MPQAIDKRGDRQPRWVSVRREYQRCLYRAEFYTWCCLRGHTGADMRDPVTGLVMGNSHGGKLALSSVVHKALARHFLQQAAVLRQRHEVQS